MSDDQSVDEVGGPGWSSFDSFGALQSDSIPYYKSDVVRRTHNDTEQCSL